MKIKAPEAVIKTLMQLRLPKWGHVSVHYDAAWGKYCVKCTRRSPRRSDVALAEFDSADLENLDRLRARADYNATLMKQAISNFGCCPN